MIPRRVRWIEITETLVDDPNHLVEHIGARPPFPLLG